MISIECQRKMLTDYLIILDDDENGEIVEDEISKGFIFIYLFIFFYFIIFTINKQEQIL